MKEKINVKIDTSIWESMGWIKGICMNCNMMKECKRYMTKLDCAVNVCSECEENS